MRIGVRLFISSLVFAIAIAAAYWWATHDAVGVILLGTMASALVLFASYILIAERESNLASDHTDMTPSDVAGEVMGVFSFESYWPFVAAVGCTLLLLGVVFLPGVSAVAALFGAALIAFAARFLILEST